jgi:hypothetical protein
MGVNGLSRQQGTPVLAEVRAPVARPIAIRREQGGAKPGSSPGATREAQPVAC